MRWRKLFNFIDHSWSCLWVNFGFDLHFLPPEVVKEYLIQEEQCNGN